MKECITKNKKVLLILLYFIVLITMNIYTREKFSMMKNETTALIIYGKENHEELFNNRKGIVSYRRALSFHSGEDNDIIYTPEIVMNSDGSASYKEKLDTSKLNWRNLPQSHENNIILAYSASTCDIDLEGKEIAINVNYTNTNYSSFLNKEIVFKYNEELIPLNIKKIENFDIYSLICISDELYNDLINYEENYIYDIKTSKYKTHEELYYDLENLENNNFFSRSQPSYDKSVEYAKKMYSYSDTIDFLNYINLITIVITIIVICCFIVNYLKKQLEKED